MAGSRVSDATMVTATTVAAPMPRPWMKLTPISSMPSSEITTVSPAKVTARPDVSSEMATDSSTVWPRWSCSRKRVTMKSA